MSQHEIAACIVTQRKFCEITEAKAYASLNKKKIELLWEDRRASDRDERLRLYQITPAGKE